MAAKPFQTSHLTSENRHRNVAVSCRLFRNPLAMRDLLDYVAAVLVAVLVMFVLWIQRLTLIPVRWFQRRIYYSGAPFRRVEGLTFWC